MIKNTLLKRTLCFLMAGSLMLAAGCGNHQTSASSSASSETSSSIISEEPTSSEENTDSSLSEDASASSDDSDSVLTPVTRPSSDESSSSDEPDASSKEETETVSHERPDGYEPYYEDSDSTAVSLEDLPRDSFDEDEYNDLLSEFKDTLKKEDAQEDLFQLYDQILLSFDDLYTDMSLVQYDFYCDPSDSASEEKQEQLQELTVDLQDQTYTVFHDVFDTSYADAFTEYVGEDLADQYKEYEPLTEEEETLINEINALTNDYAEKSTQEYDTTEEADAQEQELKELYVELVNKNNELAVMCDYDSYVDYAYDMYYRDYTADDIEEMYDMIMEEYMPLLCAYSDQCVTYGTINDTFSENFDDQETKYQNVIDYIYEINPELGETMDHLFETGLINMESSETKMEMGYTSSLPAFKDAYIFYKPYDMNYDYSTLIHEFGHYNAFYHKYRASLTQYNILDVEEIQSQGLEVLFYNYYPKVNSEFGEALQEYTIYHMLNVIIDAYIINKIEYQAYTTEDLTVDKLDAIVEEVTGSNILYSEFSLTAISHVYETPFYYISYGTSALAALELFTLSQTDYDKAVETYMNLSKVPDSLCLEEVLEEIGLDNVCDKENVVSLAGDLANTLGLSDVIPDYKEYLAENQ